MSQRQGLIDEGRNELRRVRGLMLEWNLADQKAFNDAKNTIDSALDALSAEMVVELVGFVAVERTVKMMEETK